MSVAVTRFHWFRIARFVSYLVVACSGVALIHKVLRILCQKKFLWRFVPLNHSKVMDETVALTALAAVKAASSVAAEVANLSQVMLAIQSQVKLRAMKLVRDLQSQSLKLIEAEHTMRCIMEERDRRKQASTTNGTYEEKGYEVQLKSPELMQHTIEASSVRAKGHQSSGNHADAPQLNASDKVPQSRSFLEVMAMLERGETPPGIKNINDKPPIPNQLPSVSYLQPKPKPWEKVQRATTNMLHT